MSAYVMCTSHVNQSMTKEQCRNITVPQSIQSNKECTLSPLRTKLEKIQIQNYCEDKYEEQNLQDNVLKNMMGRTCFVVLSN